jgi:hypothetical protein
MARAAPISPEINHHGLRIARIDDLGLEANVRNARNSICHISFSFAR